MTGSMLSHALHASFADRSEQRASDRRVLRLEARAATPAGEGGIQVHNLSRTGMLVEAATDVPVGTNIEVELPGGARHEAQVVWSDEGLFGCRFAKPLSQATLSAALLRAVPQAAEDAAARRLTQGEAFAKLRQHWQFEHETAANIEKPLPLGSRLWIIGGLGLAGWAVPAAAAWMLT